MGESLPLSNPSSTNIDKIEYCCCTKEGTEKEPIVPDDVITTEVTAETLLEQETMDQTTEKPSKKREADSGDETTSKGRPKATKNV